MQNLSEHPEPIAKRRSSELIDWTVQAILGNPYAWPFDENASNFELSRHFFQNESVGPLCHYALQTACAEGLVPKTIRDLLFQERQTQVALELFRGQMDERVLRSLNDIGLRPIVLKGAAYARTLYPESHLRPRCDTDLLLSDRESAQRAITYLGQFGYEVVPRLMEGRYVTWQQTCVKPVAGGHALDLHWAVSNTFTFARALPNEELEEDAVLLPSLHQQARTLGIVHSLLHACAHFFGHQMFLPLPRILWMYDIYLLSQRMSVRDWESFVGKAIEKGIAGVCRYSLDRTNNLFPMPIMESWRGDLLDAEVCETFRPNRLNNHLLFRLRDLGALDGLEAKIRWIYETMFPPPLNMLRKYGKKNPVWLPPLYLYYISSGVVKYLRMGLRLSNRQ